MTADNIPELPHADAELLDLGAVIGQNHSFGLIAGRCTAAQAASLWKLREERKYLRVSPNWREFCAGHLKIAQTQADEIIRLWQEFGTGYFELAQLTRISPQVFRAIAPAIREGVLHTGEKAIELSVENSREVAAAVAELRRRLPSKKPARQLSVPQRLAKLDQLCSRVAAEFADISRRERQGENWLQFTGILMRWSEALRRIEMENGIV